MQRRVEQVGRRQTGGQGPTTQKVTGEQVDGHCAQRDEHRLDHEQRLGMREHPVHRDQEQVYERRVVAEKVAAGHGEKRVVEPAQ